MSLDPRKFTAYECDHLRPNVRVDGVWHHLLPSGEVGGECTAGTYKVEATYDGQHYLVDLVRDS